MTMYGYINEDDVRTCGSVAALIDATEKNEVRWQKLFKNNEYILDGYPTKQGSCILIYLLLIVDSVKGSTDQCYCPLPVDEYNDLIGAIHKQDEAEPLDSFFPEKEEAE